MTHFSPTPASTTIVSGSSSTRIASLGDQIGAVALLAPAGSRPRALPQAPQPAGLAATHAGGGRISRAELGRVHVHKGKHRLPDLPRF